MRFFTTVLALATAVSAVDIRLYYSSYRCDGAYIACTNINPDVCCYSDAGKHLSAGLSAVPYEWTLIFQAYDPPGCDNILPDMRSGHCLGAHPNMGYSGGIYWFHPEFLSFVESSLATDTCSAEASCTPQTPDLLSLEDGQKYNIAGLDETLLKPLLEYASNGTTAEGIPEIYSVLAMEG